jgi:hypothetical protein
VEEELVLDEELVLEEVLDVEVVVVEELEAELLEEVEGAPGAVNRK